MMKKIWHNFIVAVLFTIAGLYPQVAAADVALWDAQIKTMLERQEKLTKEADAAFKAWKNDGSKYRAYRNAYKRLKSFRETTAKTAESIKIAKNDRWNSIFIKTNKALDDMFEGYLWAVTPVSIWIFGASDKDVYGENWERVEAQFAAIRKEMRAIRSERQKLREGKPNEARGAELKARAEQLKHLMDNLNGSYYAEASNVGFRTTLWGESWGQYIETLIKNFNVSDMVIALLTQNFKYLFDQMKPLMLQEYGYQYVHPKEHPGGKTEDGLTTGIAGELTAAILGASGNISVLKKVVQASVGKATDKLGPMLLTSQMKKSLAKDLERKYTQWVKNAPYKTLANRQGNFSKTAWQSFYSAKYEREIQDKISKQFRTQYMPDKGKAVAGKAGSILGAIGNVMTWGSEAADFYAKNSDYKKTMKNACKLTKGWRNLYRAELRKEDSIYKNTNMTEPRFVNKMWNNHDLAKLVSGYKEPKSETTGRRTRVAAQEKLEEAQAADIESIDPDFRDDILLLESAANDLRSNTLSAGDFISLVDGIKASLKIYVIKAEQAIGKAQEKYYKRMSKINTGAGSPAELRAYFKMKSKLEEPIAKANNKLWEIREATAPFYNRYDELEDELVAEAEPLYKALKPGLESAREAMRGLSQEVGAGDDYNVWVDAPSYIVSRAKSEMWDIYEMEFTGSAISLFPVSANVPDLGQEVWDNYNSGKIDPASLSQLLSGHTQALRQAMKDYRRASQFLEGKQNELNAIADKYHRILAKRAKLAEQYSRNQELMDFVSHKWSYAQRESYGSVRADLSDYAPGDGEYRYQASALYNYQPDYTADQIAKLQALLEAFQRLIGAGTKRVIASKIAFGKLDKIYQNLQKEEESYEAAFSSGDRYFLLNEWLHYSQEFEKGGGGQYIWLWKDRRGDVATLKKKFRGWISLMESYANKLSQEIGKLDSTEASLLAAQEQYSQAYKEFTGRVRNLQAGYDATYSRSLVGDVVSIINRIVRNVGPTENVQNVRGLIQSIRSYEIEAGQAIDSAEQARRGFPTLLKWDARDRELARKVSALEQLVSKAKKIMITTSNSVANNDALDAVKKQLDALHEQLLADLKGLRNFGRTYIADTQLLARVKALETEIGGMDDAFHRAWINATVAFSVKAQKRQEAEEEARRKKEEQKQKLLEQQQQQQHAQRQQQQAQDKQDIESFYSDFKQAYESRNVSRVMRLISDDWEAPDGSTLDDMEDTLRGSFSVFDAIRYNIKSLRLDPVREGVFRATYQLTLIGEIYDDGLTNEEHQSVIEEIARNESGKFVIIRTLSGQFWH